MAAPLAQLAALAPLSLTALALGGLLAAGAVRAIGEGRPARKLLAGRHLRRFVARSEGGGEAWRQLVELAAAGEEGSLLARAPRDLGVALHAAAHLAFSAPSRYEALVRVLSHGADKDDLDGVLGHEPVASLPRSSSEDERRAEQRYRASRQRLRARALLRLGGLADEVSGARRRLVALVALAAAPWPALLLLLAPGPARASVVALAALTAGASAVLGACVAERAEA